jgi:hypothetical protein
MFRSSQRWRVDAPTWTRWSFTPSLHVTVNHEPATDCPAHSNIMSTDLRLSTAKIVRPDKDRFLNEDNPFEDMMSRFDRAAELLDLEPGLYKILRSSE